MVESKGAEISVNLRGYLIYVSPHNPNPPRPSAAPEDTDERLATFVRNRREEFRVSLAEYEGHTFVSLRVWTLGYDGAMWPTRKGVTVRLQEVGGLADALANLAERLGSDARLRATENAARRTPFDRLERAAGTSRTEFDEFADDWGATADAFSERAPVMSDLVNLRYLYDSAVVRFHSELTLPIRQRCRDLATALSLGSTVNLRYLYDSAVVDWYVTRPLAGF